MRFVFFSFPARTLRLSGNPGDWPLVLRFAVAVVPASICIALFATWLGYNAATVTLSDSLEALPLLEAKVQADHLNRTYTHLRHSLERIAQLPDLNAQELQQDLELYFQDALPLVGEFALYSKSGPSFLLLRDGDLFREIAGSSSSPGDYSLFQQVAGLSLIPGKAMLLPVVFAYHPSSEGKDRPRKEPVIRMVLPFADGSGALVAGIDLDALQKKIGVYSRINSPLRSPLQEDILQVSYFFDTEGWVLFEMTGTEQSGFFPDLARRGYTGDLGRPGYDAAFRPWGAHEDYWRMITEVKENRSGSSPATAEHYSSAQAQNRAFLCYAPVYFAPSDASPPQLIGGIAFFETSNLPLAAFLRVANVSLFITVGAIAIMVLLVTLAGRRLGRPLNFLAMRLKSMNESGEFLTVEAVPACMEHQKLLASTNALISRAMMAQTNLERIQREVLRARARSPVDLAQLVSSPSAKAEFDLVGSSVLINEVREQVRKAARAGTDVLIWGETGTGKELVAAAIHKASTRSDGPYISINCGALDESLLLDTLFGHVKGAFTEAKTDRKGAFLSANGGTLHLDEIANASSKVQQALLRALSVRRIRPLGSDVEISFNTRVVAATNVDLRECVRAGTFREDLYYRLAIISIETPPLRHRKEDIPQLAAFCIYEAAMTMGHPEARLSRGALELMAAHDWPGNVREFKNCLTRAMAFVEGDLILPQHIVLEQDAFRAYGKPVPAKVLAGRFSAVDFQEPASSPPAGRERDRANAGGQAGRQDHPEAEARPDSGAPHSPMGTGHAAEYLWPAPPRDAFTPARQAMPADPEAEAGSALPGSGAGGEADAASERSGQTGHWWATGGASFFPDEMMSHEPDESAGQIAASPRAAPPVTGDGFSARKADGGASPAFGPQAPEEASGPMAAERHARSVPGSAAAQASARSVPGATPIQGGPARPGLPDHDPHASLLNGTRRPPARGATRPVAPQDGVPQPHFPQGTGQNERLAAGYTASSDAGRRSIQTDASSEDPRAHALPSPVVLNERQQRGLEFLRANGAMTRAQYEDIAGRELSARTAQNDLKELVELGFLERVGAGPGIRYLLRRHTGGA